VGGGVLKGLRVYRPNFQGQLIEKKCQKKVRKM